MTTLYLIRHGETHWNAEGRIQGHKDSLLNSGGLAQAKRLADRLVSVRLDAVYTSDLLRAAETARLIASPHHLSPILDPRLREASLGEWEGLTIPEVAMRWPDAFAAWRLDSVHHRPPGGESLQGVQSRVADAMHDIVTRHPDAQIAVIGHGGSVKAVVTLALAADLTAFRHLRIDNCSLSVITYTNGRYAVAGLNDICHLHASLAQIPFDDSGDQERPALFRPQ